jgi:hypothetical protein
MIDLFTRRLRNINVETELLEALDWSEEDLQSLGKLLSSLFEDKVAILEIKNSVEEIYGVHVWKIIERQMKIELDFIRNIPEA